VEGGNALLDVAVMYWTWVPPEVEAEHSADWRKHVVGLVDTGLHYGMRVCWG